MAEGTQRRLAAIVLADVVGYSRLMGADETGTLARLKALRTDLLDPKIDEYGGRIVKTTGDRIHGTGKLDQKAVAGRLENAAAELFGCRVKDILPQLFKARQRAGFVGTHQPRIADNIRRQDRRQSPFRIRHGLRRT